MDYRIKKVGDSWKFLPEREKLEKLEYETLWNKVRKIEKKIEKENEKIKVLKREFRELKKERTKEYNRLVKYHKEFIPTFSISFSKNPKYKSSTTTSGSVQHSGNLSWTIYVRVQGKRKPIYLGTMKNVNEKLDLIESTLKYGKLTPHRDQSDLNRISRKVEKLVYPLIKRDMLVILKKDGNLDSFLENKVTGMKYLDELYKNSEYYEEPQPKKPQPKGKRMNVFRPPPSYWLKQKEEKEK